MAEIRQNLATREWVVIATERAKRPEDFVHAPEEGTAQVPAHDADCPFCPGNEEQELEQLRMPEQGDWQLRVVRNKYPALHAHGELERNFDGVKRSISGVGHHEVLVETRLHNALPAQQPVEDVERLLLAFQQRGRELGKDGRVEQLVYFKDQGARAGSSLQHPHAQLVALPVVPHTNRGRNEEAQRYFDDHGECVFCAMRAAEEQEAQRMGIDSDHFSAFIPYAAYTPFHMWILPRRHMPHFVDSSAEELRDLSGVLHRVLRKLAVGLGDPDYNYVIRTAPQNEQRSEYLHWYMAVVPRVSHTAGFEMGTGMFINTALPEESARFLREVSE